jgi:hypothetical protein
MTAGLSMTLLGGYGLLGARAYRSARRRGIAADAARLFAASCVVGKLPQALGQGLYWLRRTTNRQGGLIEYKTGR